ncbi:MAG: TRAP transporter substrate-binding protein [Acetobacteraceae bacterium]|nr:TRAP transporter substrate-binding protein [Acetobacteraceae bacterium]
MAGSFMVRAIQVAVCLLMGVMPARAADAPSSTDIVGLETGGSSGITIRLAEDLAGLIDDGATRRLLPLVGHGGLSNIADLLEGRGVDMAFLQLDVLDFARAQKLFPDLETKLSYIAKLNYVEFHLLARPEITAIGDLAGQVVSVGPRSGNTAITATQLFRLLKVSPILGNEDPGVAIDKLRRGEIAAVAFVGGKPAPLLRLADTAGLHLVPVPMTQEVVAAYVPSRFNATDYPGLISRDTQVETVAVATGLFAGPVAAGSDEYRKLANVVDTFFTQFQTLLAPGHHGKWAEVNLSSQIAGWQRFTPADEWLKRNAAVAAGQDLRTIFLRFLEEREKASTGPQMSREQKDALFDQFRRWQSGQSN